MADDLEKTLGEVQNLNQQLQMLLMQRQTFTAQQREIKLALDEVEQAAGDVYKSIGPILIKSDKAKLVQELGETNEQIELHTKAMDSQEKRIKDALTAAHAKLQKLVKPQHGTGG